MTGLKLYEINDQIEILFLEIAIYAENNDGEIPAALDIELEKLTIEKEKKVLDIARYIKSLKAEAEAIKNEMEKLKKRYNMNKNYANRLKQYLKVILHTGEKYKDSNTLLSWRKSETVKIINENIIPDIYFKIEKTPILSMIKTELKKGIEISGAEIIHNDNLLIR